MSTDSTANPSAGADTADRWAQGRYHVVLNVEKLTGGIPKNPEMIKGWLAARGVRLGLEATATAEAEKLGDTATEEASWKGFYSDENGLFIEARNIRGMLKQAARAAGTTKVVKAALKKLTDNLRIEPERIYPYHDGVIFTPIKEASEQEERAVHVITPAGPRTGLKRSDILRNVRLNFDLVPSHPDLSEIVLRELVTYASLYLGVGSDVSQGDGHFRVVEFKRVA